MGIMKNASLCIALTLLVAGSAYAEEKAAAPAKEVILPKMILPKDQLAAAKEAASANVAAAKAATTPGTTKDTAPASGKEATSGKESVGKEMASSKDAAGSKDAKTADSSRAAAAKESAMSKDSTASKDASTGTEVAAKPKRQPVKIDPAKEAARAREYERAKNYARGINPAPATGNTSKATEAQLRAIIASQQEELEYLKSIAHDVKVIKHSTLNTGYSYP
jgi:hypothetical protein